MTAEQALILIDELAGGILDDDKEGREALYLRVCCLSTCYESMNMASEACFIVDPGRDLKDALAREERLFS